MTLTCRFLLIVVLSIPLGVLLRCRHSGGALDKALTVVNQVLMAVPAFFTGILLTYLFGLLLRWFVPGSFVSPGGELLAERRLSGLPRRRHRSSPASP